MIAGRRRRRRGDGEALLASRGKSFASVVPRKSRPKSAARGRGGARPRPATALERVVPRSRQPGRPLADGRIFRVLSERGLSDWRTFAPSPLFAELVEEGKLVGDA